MVRVVVVVVDCRWGRVAVPSDGVGNDLSLAMRASRQHQMVTTADVEALGISAARWQRMQDAGWWVPVTPRHFRPAPVELTLDMQVRAGLDWLGSRSALFGSTALWWLGVEVDEPWVAEFLVPRRRRSSAEWMIVHSSTRWSDHDVTRHAGLRTSNAARALVDLAGSGVSARDIERSIDSAIRLRRTSLVSLRATLRRLSGTGRTGCSLMRELILDSGGESFLERRFLQLVRRSGLPRPTTQVTFKRAGDRPMRVDFLFGSTVVVEVSGRHGHSTDSDRRKDAHRRNELQQRGLLVLEFTTADVIDDPAHVVRTLRQSLPVSG